METKQRQIEKLVIDYFRNRPDTEVTLDQHDRYQVRLQSEVAQTDFGGKERLSLVFDSEFAYLHPDCELITANHPFLDILRNDLERYPDADPHLSEAHLVAQLVSPSGYLVVPQLVFFGSIQKIDPRIWYRPTFILTYRVVYETDERSDSLIHLCYDALNGKPRPELLARLSTHFPVDGPPPQAQVVQSLDLASILNTAHQEIEMRVQANVQILGQQINIQLQSEKARLTEHYEKQIEQTPPQNGDIRKQLKDTFDKDIADLERKLICHAKAQLLSVLCLWWPMVDYSITFAGKQHTVLIEGIQYSAQIGQTTFFHCDGCRNRIHYSICIVGKHAVCGGQAHEKPTQCATCQEVYCAEHGVKCSSCAAPVCQDDYRSCCYGNHKQSHHYCPQCLVESFEGRLLCTTCLEKCDICHRAFPHELITTCRVGKEHICQGHGRSPDAFSCAECSNAVCRTHAVYTSDERWACQDHVRVSTCCQKTSIKSMLTQCCVDKQEWLCQNDRHICKGCGQAVCKAHSLALTKHKGAFVCDNCRRTCDQCGVEASYIASDLAVCNTPACYEQVCVAHRSMCAICKDIVCSKHLSISVDGYQLCPKDAKVSTCCQKIFVRSHLVPCADNANELLCPAHRAACQGCGLYMCTTHRSALANHAGKFTCNNCRRTCDQCGNEKNYLASDLATCKTCNTQVCSDHRSSCAACREVVCRKHISVSVDGYQLCPKDVKVSTCCQKIFVRSHLVPCADNANELLCPAHRAACQNCGRYACANHQLALSKHAGQFVCSACRRTCTVCLPERIYLLVDLVTCHTCRQPACSDHRDLCIINREVVCAKHRLVSTKGETLCQSHAGLCAQCRPGAIHRVDALQVCVTCRKYVCEEHRGVCQICQSYYTCHAHRQAQPVCTSCGRTSCGGSGCNVESYRCRSCGMPYCRHCISSMGVCWTCRRLEQSAITNDTYTVLQSAYTAMSNTDLAQTLKTMIESSQERLTVWQQANRTFKVVVVRYTPGLLKMWKTNEKVRIVSTLTNQVVRVIRERADE